MQNYLESIKKNIQPLKEEIINHKIYQHVNSMEDIRIFMSYHVYAVWDFMSLLKSLQNELTCTSIPWFPKHSPETRFLINEIVVGEESDLDQNGNRKSHFELYLEAMIQTGANVNCINNFIEELQNSFDFSLAYQQANTPKAIREFVDFTFEIINSKKTYLQAAIFTFGREDLIPEMFMSIINKIDKNFPNEISIFKYYIERHIEVDGGHHSHLAIQMTENLCENNPKYWEEAEDAIILSLKQRIKLWDAVYEEILKNKENQTAFLIT